MIVALFLMANVASADKFDQWLPWLLNFKASYTNDLGPIIHMSGKGRWVDFQTLAVTHGRWIDHTESSQISTITQPYGMWLVRWVDAKQSGRSMIQWQDARP